MKVKISYIVFNKQMSQTSIVTTQEQATTVKETSTLQRYLQQSRLLLRKIKKFNYKSLFDDILTFCSIIIAYFLISFTYLLNDRIEKMINIDFSAQKTLTLIVFAYSIYHIIWNLVSYFFKRRAERPPPKKEEYQEEQIEQKTPHPSLICEDSTNKQPKYHQIINDSLIKSIYLFIILLSISTYAYINQKTFKGVPKLVDIEKLSYIGVWFILANLFYTIGKIFQKLTNLASFKILGIAMGSILGLIVLGLANGLNTFICI